MNNGQAAVNNKVRIKISNRASLKAARAIFDSLPYGIAKERYRKAITAYIEANLKDSDLFLGKGQ